MPRHQACPVAAAQVLHLEAAAGGDVEGRVAARHGRVFDDHVDPRPAPDGHRALGGQGVRLRITLVLAPYHQAERGVRGGRPRIAVGSGRQPAVRRHSRYCTRRRADCTGGALAVLSPAGRTGGTCTGALPCCSRGTGSRRTSRRSCPRSGARRRPGVAVCERIARHAAVAAFEELLGAAEVATVAGVAIAAHERVHERGGVDRVPDTSTGSLAE